MAKTATDRSKFQSVYTDELLFLLRRSLFVLPSGQLPELDVRNITYAGIVL